MAKKYIVRLTEEERAELRQVIKKLKGSSQKVRRAQFYSKQMLKVQTGQMSK
jgi:hypothetical protein